jgi:hypothetical protein
MNLTEQLRDITGDLLSEKANLPFIEQLFALPPATWSSVASLASSLSRPSARLRELGHAVDESLQVCWLDHPASAHGADYVLIIFFLEDDHWSSVATYNRSAVERADS